jgi:hypothetical protein
MTTKSIPEVSTKYFCETCNYFTCKKSNYNKHILTGKHNNDNKNNKKVAKSSHDCDICNKKFNDRAGLWRHKKKCVEGSSHMNDDEQIQTNLILELVKQNQEFKELLIQQSNQLFEQNKQLYETHEVNMDLQKQLLEVVKDGKTINNTINTSNSHNKTFNLQVFLNETCKDAMNIKDFIQSLELNLTDLEKVGELGYAEGISRMFIKGLNSLDITKRPIHCSDVKREIMHIKHEDKWEKDNANQDKLKNIIKQLTHKNIMMLDDWKKANPGCTEYNSKKYDRYLKLTLESMGPTDEDTEKRDFNKIIRRVAENTTIDKKYLVV